MCQLDLAGNWTTSDTEHSSNVLSKEAKMLGKHVMYYYLVLTVPYVGRNS